jgi:hypothetical protein
MAARKQREAGRGQGKIPPRTCCYWKKGIDNYLGSCIRQKKNSSKTQRFSKNNSKVY